MMIVIGLSNRSVTPVVSVIQHWVAHDCHFHSILFLVTYTVALHRVAQKIAWTARVSAIYIWNMRDCLSTMSL